MRALVFDGALRLDMNAPEPQPDADEALLRICCSGICNTDLELMAGMYNFSGIPGHEFIAKVLQGPAELVGQRVVGEINVACGSCDFCRHDIPSQCQKRRTVGIHGHPGAFAERLALMVRNLHVVDVAVSDAAAVFVEPLAAALQVTEAVHISPRDRVIVIGAGKLGMLVAQVLKLTGANVIVVVRREKQAILLNAWQIPAVDIHELETGRAQVVVDCTGSAEGFEAALDLVAARGTIVLKSTYHKLPSADLTRVAVKEIRVVGSRCGPFASALRLLRYGLVDVESLIEARYPFDQAIEAMQHAAQPGALKILLDF